MTITYVCPRCEHDLVDISICTYPSIHKKECPNCGWSFEYPPQQMFRIPFHPDYQHTIMKEILSQRASACENCSCNPKNGGTGICHCILGQQIIY